MKVDRHGHVVPHLGPLPALEVEPPPVGEDVLPAEPAGHEYVTPRLDRRVAAARARELLLHAVLDGHRPVGLGLQEGPPALVQVEGRQLLEAERLERGAAAQHDQVVLVDAQLVAVPV